jgi:glycosyltransferase involved in cell wall biosynthesis
LEYYIEKYILTQIKYDTIITVGKSLFQYKNINKHIVLIGNGINMDEFHSKKYLPHNTYKILFVGRFDEFKGIDILIKAISSIKNTAKKNIEVHLVGYGYEEKKYQEMVKTL